CGRWPPSSIPVLGAEEEPVQGQVRRGVLQPANEPPAFELVAEGEAQPVAFPVRGPAQARLQVQFGHQLRPAVEDCPPEVVEGYSPGGPPRIHEFPFEPLTNPPQERAALDAAEQGQSRYLETAPEVQSHVRTGADEMVARLLLRQEFDRLGVEEDRGQPG